VQLCREKRRIQLDYADSHYLAIITSLFQNCVTGETHFFIAQTVWHAALGPAGAGLSPLSGWAFAELEKSLRREPQREGMPARRQPAVTCPVRLLGKVAERAIRVQ
jgi:hypothetical protein